MDANIDSLRPLAQVCLPDFNRLRDQGLQLARQIEIGRSAFMQKFGVESELEYKRLAMQSGQIMYHAHVGMNDIDSTAAALSQINQVLDDGGFVLDRAGFAIDRRMGLPTQYRAHAAAETGPMLVAQNDWDALAQTAPIQPHLGDFMIGQPASVANTLQALRIGCTTIGNLSQYFTFEAPGWSDAEATVSQTYQAIVLLSAFRDCGTILHSYLEDGYGALFRHCATVAAWAMLERYIVEELIGARISHCIGGLTSDPVKRAGWVLALHQIHQGQQVGSMIYGDTISFGQSFEQNRALTAEYLLWDILIQLHAPSGHAVLPLPVTEAIRIPSADEIVEAQLFGRRVEASARRLYPHVDFSAAQAFSDNVCRQGSDIYRQALDGLRDIGVDITNPLQMLFVLKKMGPQRFEQLFAAGLDAGESIETDIYSMAQDVVAAHRPMFADAGLRKRVAGKCFVIASSDVHAHAAGALAQLLGETDARVIYLGAEQNPADLVSTLGRQPVDALLLSTHNGMALEYARQLKQLLQAADISTPVIMGGVLNQKTEDQSLPVSVIDELKALGMFPVTALPAFAKLLEFKS